MSKRILFQFDGDDHPSSFDAVVAIDSEIDHLVSYGQVHPSSVRPLVHGCMFTRGGDDLRHTAIFIGGSDVDAAEHLLHCVTETFFGPVRVSVMLDANGCNTTAAAAVVAASRHIALDGARAVVLGGTGPVGQRVARLLASDGAAVSLTSRSLDRAQEACDAIGKHIQKGSVSAAQAATREQTADILQDAQIVIACGAAGVELANEETIRGVKSLAVAIDLNAVPPAGIGGIGAMDKAKAIGSGVGYGAIGVGGLKMKTHKAAIKSLFTSNDLVLDADEIFAMAKSVESGKASDV
ncbi:NADP-dependent methylenetetrahydromethanopterin/methylenetetrahydrofolate dehydrogenase [Stieleria varia]|uniref:Bifunctional protein MdtA n=1 Tax=Stieleria varia TaxID=2528005 RepID=A0A5C6AYC6_9BACT|nr:NADP-dependent methylenetetrahydromethanopterin/methylenetetrahydrofolate dehydrogenase [Stieleria varia]TWU04487.1 Bifunctional protein MdtA [Stieleria varia]